MIGSRIKRNSDDGNILGFPRLGKLKTGYKTEQNGKTFPRSCDYFVPSGMYAELFTKAYGSKPQTIQIVFPSDNPAAVCRECYEYRDDKGGLIAQGDGQNFKVWNETKKTFVELSTENHPDLMQYIQTKKPNMLARQKGNGWRVSMCLNFIVPAVQGVAGVWTFESHGDKSTIPNVTAAFDMMLEQRGKVKGVLFDLSVKFAQSQAPDSISRFPVVSLIPNESEQAIERLKAAIGTNNNIKMLQR